MVWINLVIGVEAPDEDTFISAQMDAIRLIHTVLLDSMHITGTATITIDPYSGRTGSVHSHSLKIKPLSVALATAIYFHQIPQS